MPGRNEKSLLKLQDLIAAVGGVSLSSAAKVALGCFTSVATDSRAVSTGSLFVPLAGNVQNGHVYIPQALEKGARVVFITREEYESSRQKYATLIYDSQAVFIQVENTLSALQRAAAAYVQQFPSLIKIGITGSSGKTTTKELVASVLSQKYSVITNEGNLNSETGLPLSVFKIQANHQVGVFEMGMNRRGEIAELAAVLFPDLALITNIGTAHIGILGSKDKIAEEKKSIFSFFSENSVAFIPANDSYADFLASGVRGAVIRFGNGFPQVLSVKDRGLDGTGFVYRKQKITLPLPGTYNFSNALAAIAIAEHLSVTPEQVKKGFESIHPLFGRSQVIKGVNTLINDCYNANPDSMERAVEFFGQIRWKKQKILVLGDMLELGEESKSAHAAIGVLAAQTDADMVVFYGEQMSAAAESFAKTAASGRQSYYSTEITEIQSYISSGIKRGALALLKASKGMALWRVSCSVVGDQAEKLLGMVG